MDTQAWLEVTIGFLGIVATVIIAIMTFRIAKRQTEIAEESKRLADVATDATTKQAELSERITKLEELRAKSMLVPSDLSWTGPDQFGDYELRLQVHNLGEPCWSVHFSAIIFVFEDAGGQRQEEVLALVDSAPIEFCDGQTHYTTRVGGPIAAAKPGTSVLIKALTGLYRDKFGVQRLSHELAPGVCEQLRTHPAIGQLEETYATFLR